MVSDAQFHPDFHLFLFLGNLCSKQHLPGSTLTSSGFVCSLCEHLEGDINWSSLPRAFTPEEKDFFSPRN